MNKALLANIPQVDQILNHAKLAPYLARLNRDFVLNCVREEIADVKERILQTSSLAEKSKPDLLELIAENSQQRIQTGLKPSLKKVINATGVILHTGLGRAPLPEEARSNLLEITQGYCNLELDLNSGKRGERIQHIETLLCQLTGAEAACVVNNNAAAVLLTLNSLSEGKQAIISRGQLIEIGGSFRIPEVIAKSGALMVEVGTTNKTHLYDYDQAITKDTAVILAIHTSNYRIKGFTEEVEVGTLVDLAKKHKLIVVQDLGGGVFVDLQAYDLPYEPVVKQSVATGVDVITFSGDKVLGGPQSGLIVGKKKYVDRIKSNPLMRALRCGKLTYAALEPTLKLYLNESELLKHNRVFNKVLEPLESLTSRAHNVMRKLNAKVKSEFDIRLEDSKIQIGSGALPLEEIASKALSLKATHISTENLAKRFRLHHPPILGYIRGDRLYFDFRTIFPDEEPTLVDAMKKILVRG
ncbi:MAG: L-seryl-tRNA(Sec) selenium transferase [bacterium]